MFSPVEVSGEPWGMVLGSPVLVPILKKPPRSAIVPSSTGCSLSRISATGAWWGCDGGVKY